MPEIRLLDCAAVLRATGIPRSTWFRMRSEGRFPPGLRLSTNPHHVVFPSDVVNAWIREHRSKEAAA